jgi:hypothetical protein
LSTLVRVTATGNVVTGSRYLRGIIFQPGTAISQLDLRLDGSGGAIVLTMIGAANGPPVPWRADRQGVSASQLHATLSGTAASVTFEVD